MAAGLQSVGLFGPQKNKIMIGLKWALNWARVSKKWAGRCKGGMSSDFLQFCFEHPSIFWLSFIPRISDQCKINFFRK